MVRAIHLYNSDKESVASSRAKYDESLYSELQMHVIIVAKRDAIISDF